MRLLAVVVGWALVLLVLSDVFRTVLWSGQGAGPLTGGVTAVGRRMLPLLKGRRRLLSAVGPAALLLIVTIWAALLVIGFTLALEADPGAIRTSSTRAPTDLLDRLYYVGYSLFTLGNGDLQPVTDEARLLTVVFTAIGMFLVTLSVTYLLPVISASVASRSFASSARSLGDSPEDVVIGAWDGERIQLQDQLRDLSGQLSLLAEQQLAYPVLHLFHSADPATSAPIAVAGLDDLLTLLDGVHPDAGPVATPRRQLRASIQAYLETYGRDVHEVEPPSAPDTGRLAAAGIPIIDPAAYEMVLLDLRPHRAEVRDLVRATGVDDG